MLNGYSFLVNKIKISFYIFRCLENVYFVVIKLNNFFKEGKILSDCLYYKFIDYIITFVLINLYLVLDFAWDRDVCEFFDIISYFGGNRIRNFVRGFGFVGIGRGGVK